MVQQGVRRKGPHERRDLCAHCGKPVYRPRAYNFGKHGVYCNKACWNAAQTYSPDRMFYGARWAKQRRAALKRDEHICQGCGVSAQQVKGGLHVHHVVPFKMFQDQDQANRLDNLLSLCPSCHKRADLAYHADGTILFPAPALPTPA